MTIDAPGLYEIGAEDYHADPCPTPSLNNSTIGPLLECPRLAWQAHPRLNPGWAPEEASKFDLGSAAHELLLGRGRGLVVLDFPDYRKNDAKDARDAARAAGKIPVLVEQHEQALAMVAALHNQLQAFDFADPFDLSTGKCEVGLFWTDIGVSENEPQVWCRNLIDRLRDDQPQWEIWDYKTSGTNINPESLSLSVHVVDRGYDTQCAMQERGLTALFPQLAGRIKFRLLFQSTEPPHLISVVEPDPSTMTMAHKKVEYAIRRWRECLTANRWPGYPSRIVPLRHAEFLAARWLEREIAESETLAPPPAPALRRPPGRPPGPRKEKPSRPVHDLSGG